MELTLKQAIYGKTKKLNVLNQHFLKTFKLNFIKSMLMKPSFSLKKAFVILILMVLFLTTYSCRKGASRFVEKFFTKQTVKTTIIGAAVLISIEELERNEMLNLFKKEPGNKQPGEVTIYNNISENFNILISNDAYHWHKKEIPLEEPLKFPTAEQGLAAIQSGENSYYMLKPDHEYSVSQKKGDITVEEIKGLDNN